MKQEDCEVPQNIPLESSQISDSVESSAKKKRSRSRKSTEIRDEITQPKKTCRRKSTSNTNSPTEPVATPTPKRGRPKKSTQGAPVNGTPPASKKTATKAALAGSNDKDTYSYSDLFPGEDDQDENVDAEDDDSEYAPSDEEVVRRINRSTGKRRLTRSLTKSQVSEPEVGSTDEDEAGESESEFEEDDEDELMVERAELEQSANNGTSVALFEDDTSKTRRDIYDFDAQSILSDPRGVKRRSTATASGNRASGNAIARVASHRSRRNATGTISTWGSNIYSALAASLKTRADLDAYSAFLKSTNFQNDRLDRFLADLCKPSNQHSSIFYGVSASLQSLMGRINDNDRVVELLHSFTSRPFEQMRHRVNYLAPVIHQPVFGLGHTSLITSSLKKMSNSVDPELVTKPIYLLNQDTSLLAIPSIALHEFGLTGSQYSLVTGSGNMGRFMPDMKQLIVPSDLYNKLTDFISLPPERIYEVALSRAHHRGDEPDIDVSPIEPPNLQRIVLVVDSTCFPVALAILDYWNENDVPTDRPTPFIELAAVNQDGSTRNSAADSSLNDKRSNIDEEVKEILNELIDWTVLRMDSVDGSIYKRTNRITKSVLGPLRFMDGFLVKPNGRRDYLILVTHCQNSYPPFDSNLSETEAFRVYSIFDEGQFLLERHGFVIDAPVNIDSVHTADPEELLEDQSLLVVPDLLYDTLRKVMLHEFVGVTGVSSALFNPKKSESTILPSVTQCTKFVLVDRTRRVPLAVVFDSPVRFSLHVSNDKPCIHPFGGEASKQFDHLTPTELKTMETSFKPTTAEYRLVTMGGLLYGLQIDDQKVVRRILEVTPARVCSVFPNALHPSVSAQSILATPVSYSASVRILNDETSSSTVLPAFYFPTYERQKQGQIIAAFSEHLVSMLFDLPIQISLYDVMFRLGQKHMPELLTRQHIESAEAAAYAEAAANPHAPPPAPVPMPEIWGVCCICSKELRSPNGLLDHEMRHIGLSRFRCVIHNTNFLDRRQWQQHMSEMHSTSRQLPFTAALPRVSSSIQPDSLSDQEDNVDEDDGNEQGTAPGLGLLVGLTQVFSLGVLVGRMEAPQCEKCGDYYLNADVLTQHLDFCDGVSFSIRTPIPRSQKSTENTTMQPETVDPDAVEQNPADDSESKSDTCVCGMCGAQLTSRDKILKHFSAQHLQCILCSSVLRSLEELSNHYQTHLRASFSIMEETNQLDSVHENNETGPAENNEDQKDKLKSQLQKLMACDICGNFCGTKYNFYFHQWAEHGVVHPTQNSADGSSHLVQHVRAPRQLPEQDELCFLMAGVRRIKCKFCGLVVRVAGKEYVAHLSEKHGVFVNPDVVCRICAELFETPADLSLHLGETHAPSGEYANAGVQTIFRCTHCDFWAFAKGLPKHSRDVHGDPNPAMYECTHCYERFSDKRTWRTHLDKHNESYSQRCLECGRAFRLRSSLLHHIRQYHGDEDGPATCEYCGLTYPKRGALRYHIFRIHNNELAHECTMCQRRFHIESELQMHIKEMHSGAIQCEICHKVCANLRCFAQHRQKHFRTRIYQCTDCHATFKSKLAMKRHIRVEHLQLGPERFECQICGKIVTQIGMHMLIHKEARFECEYCGKRFTKAAYYNEHLRIHLGEQPFECHICQKRFNKKSNLNVHLRFHEKHRDEEGNYLELKPRGRVSTMFGDALMSPSDRAARQAAAARAHGSHNVPKVDAIVGSDLPGAFNVSNGPAGAAEEAASRAIEEYGLDDEADFFLIQEPLS